jgi:hypothetical protein
MNKKSQEIRKAVSEFYATEISSPEGCSCCGGTMDDKTLDEVAESLGSKIWSAKIFARKPGQST